MASFPHLPLAQGQHLPSGVVYPSSGAVYLPNGAVYPSSGAVYPPSGVVYPPSGYPTIAAVYPPNTAFPPYGGHPPYSNHPTVLSPPEPEESTDAPEIPADVLKNAPHLTEEEAEEALLDFVSQHCCYGSAPAKKMTIRDIVFNSAIYYKLETYGEKRETVWAFEPYKGQGGAVLPIAAADYSQGLWNINVTREKGNFIDSQKHIEVPNTSNVRHCHGCDAKGHVKCQPCHGHGSNKCKDCKGNGYKTVFDEERECNACKGSGYQRCSSCSGEGQATCKVCEGRRHLRYYVKLTVTWKNHLADKIFETLHVPKELIREVSGKRAFKDERPRVSPIKNFPDKNVNIASKKLVEEHKTAFPEERILVQRQEVNIVPVAEVNYTLKNSTGSFFVYGFEKKVYFPNYPETCCCGCQIL